MLCTAASRQIETDVGKRCQGLKCASMRLKKLESGRGEVLFILLILVRLTELHDALRMNVRQRAQQNPIHHTENRRISPDAERERNQRNRREPGVLTLHSQGVAYVLQDGSHKTPHSYLNATMGSTCAARRAGM